MHTPDVILLVGATGHVGSAVLAHLRKLASVGQHDAQLGIRVGARNPERARAQLDADADRQAARARVEFVRFDLEQHDTHAAALGCTQERPAGDVRAVFLMRPPAMGNVRTHLVPFVDACARTGHVRLLVYLSVVGADTQRLIPHYALERHIESCTPPLAHVFLRAGYFMQNLTDDVHRLDIEERGELYVPAGRGALGLVDARDVAQVAAQCLAAWPAYAPGTARAYVLTEPVCRTFAQVADAISRAAGRAVAYHDAWTVPFVAHQVSKRRTPLAMALVMVALYGACKWNRAAVATDELGTLLGRPPTSMDEFAREHFGPGRVA